MTKEEILTELGSSLIDKQQLFINKIAAGEMTKEEARRRYNCLERAKNIVLRFYQRVEEDLKLTDELNKPEILKDMINNNPSVITLIDSLKLKVE